MVTKLERIYTIPLGPVYSKPRTRRANKAIKHIKEFAARHMKVNVEDVKVSKGVNSEIWKSGIEKPPRRVKVKMIKEDDAVKILLPDEIWEVLTKVEVEEAKPVKKESKKTNDSKKQDSKKENVSKSKDVSVKPKTEVKKTEVEVKPETKPEVKSEIKKD